MKHARLGMLFAFASVTVLSGCGPQRIDAGDPYDLGPGREIVAAAVDQIGGVDAWHRVGTIEVEALVRLYDPAGGVLVSRQRQVMRFRDGERFGPGGSITATAAAGDGQWTIRADDRGRGSFQTTGTPVAADVRDRMVTALGMVLHRVRGPLNLLSPTERVESALDMRVGEAPLVRVGVTLAQSGALAYYFDADSGLLRYVSQGPEVAGGDGTVTIYDYMRLDDVRWFPRRLRIVRMGEHLLVGEQPMLEVEFLRVRMR